jgi:type II secretory pathway component GspD/PulD (secretin)
MKADLLTPNGTPNVSQGSGLDNNQSSGTVGSLIDSSQRNGIIISLGEQFKNASISAILNLEQSVAKRNVLANPYTVTQNNVRTEIKNVQIRRGQGELSPNNTQYGGATVVKIEPYEAALGIAITPRISLGSREQGSAMRLNLEIDLSIEDFKSNADDNYDKLTRKLKTSANISSGDLLVLGGLYKQNYSGGSAKTPILGDIPLLGMLFRKNSHAESNSNLVIIIRSTIVEDYVLDSFTCGRQAYINGELNQLALANMKDPITRVYFKDYNTIKPFKKDQDACAYIQKQHISLNNPEIIIDEKMKNMYSKAIKPTF